MPTTLLLASSPGHYEAARKLMRQEEAPNVKLEVPTILAIDVDSYKVLGVVGTHYQDELIIAGPLVLESSCKRVKTALLLVEAYENAMREMGVSSFIMHVEKGSLLDEGMKRYSPEGLELYAEDDLKKYYIRRL